MKQQFKNGLAYSTDSSLKSYEENTAETLAKNMQKLKVKIDTKHRAGKVVTLIEGFIGTTEDLESLGKLLKTKCGTGGSAKDGLIVVQGDNRNKILDILSKEGYTAK